MKATVKKFNERPKHWNPSGLMDRFMGKEVEVFPDPDKAELKVGENRNGNDVFEKMFFVKDELVTWFFIKSDLVFAVKE